MTIGIGYFLHAKSLVILDYLGAQRANGRRIKWRATLPFQK